MNKILLVILCFCLFSCHTPNGSEGGSSEERRVDPTLFKIIEKNEKVAVLTEALKNKADPNVADANGRTPLMLAAEKNKGSFFRELVRYGAKIDMRNKAGQTAMDMVKDPRSIEDIGNKIKVLDPKKDKTAAEISELNLLTQLSLIKRYAKMANYEVPASFVEEPNPGAGSCYFYSIMPFLKEIPGIDRLKYNNFKDQADARNFLRDYLLGAAGNAFALAWLPTMQAGESARYYARPGKIVDDVHKLVQLMTNTGLFAGETFWGDDFTNGVVKQAARLSTIKIRHRKFGTGQDIFYCQAEVDEPYFGVMKYITDTHFETIKFVEPGQAAKYLFETNGALPKPVKELLEMYKLCNQ